MSQSVPERVTAEELLQLPLFADESPEAVDWISNQMEVRRFEAGDVFVREGDPATEFYVLLGG